MKKRLNYEDLKEKVGGRLEFSVLLQKRVKQLVMGDIPLVDIDEEDDFLDIALKEVQAGKIVLEEATPEELEEAAEQERMVLQDSRRERH